MELSSGVFSWLPKQRSQAVDCQAVQLGAQRGIEWATSPSRQLARAWGPLAAVLDGPSENVVWMPAHCAAKDVWGPSSPATGRGFLSLIGKRMLWWTG